MVETGNAFLTTKSGYTEIHSDIESCGYVKNNIKPGVADSLCAHSLDVRFIHGTLTIKAGRVRNCNGQHGNIYHYLYAVCYLKNSDFCDCLFRRTVSTQSLWSSMYFQFLSQELLVSLSEAIGYETHYLALTNLMLKLKFSGITRPLHTTFGCRCPDDDGIKHAGKVGSDLPITVTS